MRPGAGPVREAVQLDPVADQPQTFGIVGPEPLAQVAGELGYAPEDARLQIKDGTLEAHNDKPGRIVEAESLASSRW